MKLRELLEQINELLKANMDKEVIRTGYASYDTINGRMVINDYNFKDIIDKLDKENLIDYVSIKKAINLTFFGIHFKLKRKKSDIISSWGHTNQLTYSEILLDPNIPNQEQFLDMELSDIRKHYLNKMKEEERLRNEASVNKVESFKSKLAEIGLSSRKFKELMNDYNSLNYNEKESIK